MKYRIDKSGKNDIMRMLYKNTSMDKIEGQMKDIKVEDYIQVKPPIKPMMTEVVNAMKGTDRSMAEFASATGLSTTMLSRLVNGNYAKAFPVKILQKIAACSVEGCPLDLEDLLEANGMVSKEEAARLNVIERRHQRAVDQFRRRKEMREIVLEELFARGIAIKKIERLKKEDIPCSELFLGVQWCDLAITLPDRDNIEWGFAMLSAIREEGDTESEDASYIRRIIEYYAILFLEDAWAPNKSMNSKYTFGFVDNIYYSRFIDFLKTAKLNNRMSAILINVNARKVIKEHNFVCGNFNVTESLFDLSTYQEKEVDKENYRQITFFDRNEDVF